MKGTQRKNPNIQLIEQNPQMSKSKTDTNDQNSAFLEILQRFKKDILKEFETNVAKMISANNNHQTQTNLKCFPPDQQKHHFPSNQLHHQFNHVQQPTQNCTRPINQYIPTNQIRDLPYTHQQTNWLNRPLLPQHKHTRTKTSICAFFNTIPK